MTCTHYSLPRQLSDLALFTNQFSYAELKATRSFCPSKQLIHYQPARQFAMVAIGRRVFAAFAAVSSVAFFGYYVPQSIKVLAEEREYATCLNIVGQYTEREDRNRREGKHQAMKVERSIKNTVLLFGEREERVMDVTAADAQKAAADNNLASVEMAIKVEESSTAEGIAKGAELAIEKQEIAEVLASGKVFIEQSAKRVNAERMLLNPLNHPSAKAFFALINK